jgi:hypothetical protein
VSEHGGGGGAVAGLLAGARGHFAQHLRAHVLEAILQLDRLGHQHAGVDDLRRTVVAVEDDGAPARAQRHLDGLGQRVDAAAHARARVVAEQKSFRSHGVAFSSLRPGGSRLAHARLAVQATA